MWRKILLFLVLFAGAHLIASAQNPPAKADSSKMYRDIEDYSKKRKITKLVHGLVFKPVPRNEAHKKKKYVKQLQKPYSNFEGKIIRHINIVTCDPFGYTLTDTAAAPQNEIEKAGNTLHIKSQRITIQNLLLVHRNDEFDSLLVKESERLIRSQKYVHEVSFFVVSTGKNSDSVDIFIRVIDTWSLIPAGAISSSHVNLELTDNNFLGLGHQFQYSYTVNTTNNATSFGTNYFIPNIRNTYITTTLHYNVDELKTYNKNITVERLFFSPFAKWAGGINIARQYRVDSINYHNEGYLQENYKFNTQDYWAGTAHRIFKGNTEDERVTNLILTGRYLQVGYFEKPSALYDSSHLFTNEKFYLAGIGITARKFIQDKYVFNYGLIEDVPVGKVYGLTGGYQVKNNVGRLYLGIRYSIGNYIEWGYLSCNLEYGSFFHTSQPEQGVFTASVNYFTDLFEIGKWKFRQFVKPQLTMGLNRFPSEAVTINNENGIRGFNSIRLPGTDKLVLTFQTQSYSPWHLLGFGFGPYLNYSLGMLGNESTGFAKSHVYSEIALGVLFKNEFLVLDYFQLSISFYPIIPGVGDNIFKINPTSTTDFGFPDFSIGKPAPVAYQ